MELKSKLIGTFMGVAALTALATSFATSPATAAGNHQAAINACTVFNEYQPAQVISAV
ncbi:MAG: hypothetical protein AAF405_09270 [Pseudomonadota bacterium]